MTTWRLLDGQSGRPGVGSSGTQPPGSAAEDTGPFLAGTVLQVTQNGLWLAGYEQWVTPDGDTGTTNYALQQLTSPDHGIDSIVVPGAERTVSSLTAGVINSITLGTPVGLSAGVPYIPAAGWVMSKGFPISENQLGTGSPYAAGITSGPLMAYSSRTGSAPVPLASDYPNGVFGTNGSDPGSTLLLPGGGFADSLFWISAIVTDEPPDGAVYELFPSQPDPIGYSVDEPDNFTLGVEVILSGTLTSVQVPFFSPPGSTQLPTDVLIWDVATQLPVPGSHVVSPAWSDAAGTGIVTFSYPGSFSLPPGDFKASVANTALGTGSWNAFTPGYWTVGPGANSIVNEPLLAPSAAAATGGMQCTFNRGATVTYPDTFAAGGPNYWLGLSGKLAAAPSGRFGYLMAWP